MPLSRREPSTAAAEAETPAATGAAGTEASAAPRDDEAALAEEPPESRAAGRPLPTPLPLPGASLVELALDAGTAAPRALAASMAFVGGVGVRALEDAGTGSALPAAPGGLLDARGVAAAGRGGASFAEATRGGAPPVAGLALGADATGAAADVRLATAEAAEPAFAGAGAGALVALTPVDGPPLDTPPAPAGTERADATGAAVRASGAAEGPAAPAGVISAARSADSLAPSAAGVNASVDADNRAWRIPLVA